MNNANHPGQKILATLDNMFNKLLLNCKALTWVLSWILILSINPFQLSIKFYIETSHPIYSVNQMSCFNMKYKVELKWVKLDKMFSSLFQETESEINYSGTSLKQTLMGQKFLSALERCTPWRGLNWKVPKFKVRLFYTEPLSHGLLPFIWLWKYGMVKKK